MELWGDFWPDLTIEGIVVLCYNISGDRHFWTKSDRHLKGKSDRHPKGPKLKDEENEKTPIYKTCYYSHAGDGS